MHYAAHEVKTAEDFCDFRVTVECPRNIRRWLRPQAVFRFENNPPFNPLAAAQAFPLLEWGLNWCISTYCHQYLIIHAAVVERGGHAMILPAPPGSGKSTLCAALVSRGWRLLSDELTLLDVDDKRVIPLPRPISLKNESIARIATYWPGAVMSPIVHDTHKGSLAHVRPPVDSVERTNQRAVPRWIVVPHFSSGEKSHLRVLSRAAMLMQLADQSFNYNTHGRRGFELLADVVASSDCFEYTYGGDLNEATRLFGTLAA